MIVVCRKLPQLFIVKPLFQAAAGSRRRAWQRSLAGNRKTISRKAIRWPPNRLPWRRLPQRACATADAVVRYSSLRVAQTSRAAVKARRHDRSITSYGNAIHQHRRNAKTRARKAMRSASDLDGILFGVKRVHGHRHRDRALPKPAGVVVCSGAAGEPFCPALCHHDARAGFDNRAL